MEIRYNLLLVCPCGKKNDQNRKSNESSGNNNSKKSKVSTKKKNGSKNHRVEDIEEVILIDDEDDLELDDESISNPGNNSGLETDDVEDQVVVEFDSPPLDEDGSSFDDTARRGKNRARD